MEPDPLLEEVDDLIDRMHAAVELKPGTPIDVAAPLIFALIDRAEEIVASQPMLLELDAPIKVAGDIHGQFPDLLRIFELGGYPPDANYLFLGDYVDRGPQNIECLCLLLAYKIKYPENFFLLRGNHEIEDVNMRYGFFDECRRRYDQKLWKRFCHFFNQLPVAALIGDAILCMHGGLSPDLNSIEDIKALSRPAEPGRKGLMCDLLWSDPDLETPLWGPNDRGVSFVFGAEVVRVLSEKLDIDLIVRAHQVVNDGYEFFADQRLLTIFSAPNYTGEFDNYGAVLSIDEALRCSFHVLKPEPRIGPDGKPLPRQLISNSGRV
mgnify:CR=1 FL=1